MSATRDNLDRRLDPSTLSRLAAFVAVVDAGSFTGAAKRTGVDKTLLSRRVRALEKTLATRLLNRTTRSVQPTEAGARLFEQSRAPLETLSEALARAAADELVAGRVRVASVSSLARPLWIPVLRELRAEHPELSIELLASDNFVNLVDERIDLAVRTGNLPDSSFIAKRLARWRYVLCAAPEWIAAHPEVTAPEDLVDHWLLYGDVPNANRWRFERARDDGGSQPGEGVELRMGAALRSDSGQVLYEALLGGLGVTAMAPYMVEEDLRSGSLARVLPQWRVEHTHGVFAVTAHREYRARRVLVVLEALQRRLAVLEPAWRALSE